MSVVFSGVFKHSFICLAFAVFIHVRGGGGGGGGRGGLIQYIIGRFLSRDGSSVSEPLFVGKSSLCENERVVISTSNLSNFMRLVNSFN